MQVSARDSLSPASDSAMAATLAQPRATEYESVPARVTDGRELPPASTLGPAGALLVAGLLLGFALGTRWRRRRRH